ncbi:MAG TPA: hypothetical protein VJA27_00425 [Patescibacteria group bacterium]|nr:hypothetical protein [Patescibacteria group bacterium]
MSKHLSFKLAIVMSVLVLMGGGCILNQQTNVTKTDEADTPVRTLQDEAAKPPARTLQKDNDGRMVLVGGSYDDIPEVCKQEFSEEAPRTEVVYSNKDWGISLKVPYNPKWGNAQYSILPYVEDVSSTFYQRALNFGNVVNEAAVRGRCIIGREYVIRSTAAQTVNTVISELPSDNPFVKQETIKKKTLAGLQVVSYEVYDDLCSPDISVITILGKKFNYVLEGSCGIEMKDLEEIVRTVKLIE